MEIPHTDCLNHMSELLTSPSRFCGELGRGRKYKAAELLECNSQSENLSHVGVVLMAHTNLLQHCAGQEFF